MGYNAINTIYWRGLVSNIMETNKPILYMTVGLVASGKSTWAESHKEELDFTIHSSDNIRTELGDVNDQSKNDLVFSTLHKRIKEDILNGKNVCYDATSLNRRKRIAFLRQIKHIKCEKICVLFATPYEVCLRNNANRERKVPEEVIERMVKNFEVPCRQEGFDDIQIVYWDYKKEGMEFDITKDLCKWTKLSHNNPNHKLSVGNHMLKADECYAEMDIEEHLPLMYDVIIMHDCGKPFTKSYKNSKNEITEVAHFYQHHNVGSYLSLFYLKELEYTDEEVLYGSLLIGLHMRHFMAWQNSSKSKEKDRKLFGDKIISDLEIINQCDIAAH